MSNTRKKKDPQALSLTKEITTNLEFWCSTQRNPNKTPIHIKSKNEDGFLCNCPVNKNLENNKHWKQIDKITPTLKKRICGNCMYILAKLSSEDEIHNQTVKKAKSTVSHTSNKRLKRYETILNKTQDDFEKIIKGNQNITLPNEISAEKESLHEVLSSLSKPLTTLRQCAAMNLDKTISEWRKLNSQSQEELELIQQAKQLKSLIEAVDKIKYFPKT